MNVLRQSMVSRRLHPLVLSTVPTTLPRHRWTQLATTLIQLTRGGNADVSNCSASSCSRRDVVIIPTPTKTINHTLSLGSLNAQSVTNKSAAISNCILTRHLDFLCVVETWHDGFDSPSLISCTPQQYKFIEKARLLSDQTSVRIQSNHGGICVFFRKCFRVKPINFPHYNTFEILALSVNSSQLAATLLTVYRPGSNAVTTTFFDELADLLERCAAYSQCIIVGDINIHLDCATSPGCQQFKSLLNDCGMADFINQPTHRHLHQLDVYITR